MPKGVSNLRQGYGDRVGSPLFPGLSFPALTQGWNQRSSGSLPHGRLLASAENRVTITDS